MLMTWTGPGRKTPAQRPCFRLVAGDGLEADRARAKRDAGPERTVHIGRRLGNVVDVVENVLPINGEAFTALVPVEISALFPKVSPL